MLVYVEEESVFIFDHTTTLDESEEIPHTIEGEPIVRHAFESGIHILDNEGLDMPGLFVYPEDFDGVIPQLAISAVSCPSRLKGAAAVL